MIEVKTIGEQEYTEFTNAYVNHNILQLFRWPEVKEAWEPSYWGVYHQGRLVLATVVLERVIAKVVKMVYLARGPVGEIHHLPYLQALLEFLIPHFRGSCFFKVDLNYCFPRGEDNSLVVSIREYLETQGFRRLPATRMADGIQAKVHANLFLRECDLGTSYSTNAYRRLTKARNKFVEVECVGIEGLPSLMRFIESTEAKQGIRLRDQEYFRKLMTVFPDRTLLTLAYLPSSVIRALPQMIEELQGKIASYKQAGKIQVATEKLTFYQSLERLIREEYGDFQGEKFYVAGLFSVYTDQRLEMLYAGTLPELEKMLMPMAMLYDHQFHWAQQRGMTIASMGGVENDLQGGLYNFKKIFNPVLEEYLGEYDYVYQPLRYHLFQSLWRWKKRK